MRSGRHGCMPAVGMSLGLMLLAGCSHSGSVGTAGSGIPTPGQVSVAPDKQQYGSSETIGVIITNGLSNGIYAPDHQSNCTTVVLERWSGATWQPQNPCQLKSPTRLIPFGPGTATWQHLQPLGGGIAPAWPTGTYRIAFTYLQNVSEAGITVYSTSFTVR